MITQFKDHLDKLKGACICLMVLTLTGCSSFERTFQKDLQNTFSDEFVGFILVDPQSNEVLIEHQSRLHFTPASNTKLLTFYVADKIIGDSIPTFYYRQNGDSLWLQAGGDPSLFHPDFDQQKVSDLLKDKQILLTPQAQELPRYGSGWAWDDFTGGYQRELSWMPLYGNAVQVIQDSITQKKQITPTYFTPAVKAEDTTKLFTREVDANIFYPPLHRDTLNLPYRWNWELAALLLQESVGSSVHLTAPGLLDYEHTLYQHHKDSLLKPLLEISDNFIAEQLVIICAQMLNSRVDTTLAWLTDSLLADLPDRPIWVDGSGLSRYNMITPRSLATLLIKMKREIPQERLFSLLPVGGVSGTIERYYGSETPYIYAKTGTLRHNHNLSGYLVTKSNKVLVFSFMHNHFTTGSSAVKQKMEGLLRQLRDYY